MANEVNREYRSSLFSYMLSHKEYALQVYNVLNNSDYTDPDAINITTLENVVFINIKNDVSFVLENVFSLYEHQSTYNPNMPIRSLFYASNSYERFINSIGANIYGSALIRIPTPKFVVFYNGEREYPDRTCLKLSDAFANKNVEGDMEITVTMLNINYNHNRELLEECEVLRGYSLYNEKFREYNRERNLTKAEAANKAINYCIENNVLAEFFTKRRNEVVGMILEYTAEQAEKDIAKLEREISEKEQRIEGLGQELSEKEERIEGLGQELSEKEERIEGLGQELLEKEERIEGLGQELSEKEELIARLLEENAKLKAGK